MSWSQKSVLGFTFVCILLSCPKWLFVYFKMVDHNISFSDPSKSNHSISEMFLVFFWISIYRYLSLKYSPSNLLFIFGIIIFKMFTVSNEPSYQNRAKCLNLGVKKGSNLSDQKPLSGSLDISNAWNRFSRAIYSSFKVCRINPSFPSVKTHVIVSIYAQRSN